MRYRTRAAWWRSRPAHNPQRSNGAGPPCQPRTPRKAAQPTAQSPQPVKKEYGDGSTSFIYAYSTRQGVRFLGASHERRVGSKGALTEHPPGAGAPTGHPPGGYSESRSLIQANRRSSAMVTLQDPRPRFGKHVLGLRLSATPSDHAFRPRPSHAFQPRFPAMSSDVPFGSRTLCFCHSNVSS